MLNARELLLYILCSVIIDEYVRYNFRKRVQELIFTIFRFFSAIGGECDFTKVRRSVLEVQFERPFTYKTFKRTLNSLVIEDARTIQCSRLSKCPIEQ